MNGDLLGYRHAAPTGLGHSLRARSINMVLRCFRWNCRKRITVYNVRLGVFDSAVSPHPVPLPGGEGDPFASARSCQEPRFHKAPPAMFPSPWWRGTKGEGKRRQRIRRVSVVKQRADGCSLPRLYPLETSRNHKHSIPTGLGYSTGPAPARQRAWEGYMF